MVDLNRDGSYSLGQNVKLYKRIKQQIDNRADAAHEARVNVGNKLVQVTPDWENENIRPGTATGAIMAGIAAVVDEYLAPISADTEIANVEYTEEGIRYTVNVDAPFEQQARFRAMMEAGAGFSSLITDSYNMTEPEDIRHRMVQDTWQMEVLVEEPKSDESEKDSLGLGLLNNL